MKSRKIEVSENEVLENEVLGNKVWGTRVQGIAAPLILRCSSFSTIEILQLRSALEIVLAK